MSTRKIVVPCLLTIEVEVNSEQDEEVKEVVFNCLEQLISEQDIFFGENEEQISIEIEEV